MSKKKVLNKESTEKTVNPNLKVIEEFAHANKHLLVMVGNPVTDEVFVGFNDKNCFVKFPSTGDIKNNVVFNVLRHSGFESAIDVFVAGLMRAFEDDDGKKGVQLYKVIGGSLLSISEIEKLGRDLKGDKNK